MSTRNLEALDTYFLGKQLLEERNVRSLQAAVEYFEKVVELDPDFAGSMLRYRIGCLPVVDEGGNRLVGLITESDLIRAAYESD